MGIIKYVVVIGVWLLLSILVGFVPAALAVGQDGKSAFMVVLAAQLGLLGGIVHCLLNRLSPNRREFGVGKAMAMSVLVAATFSVYAVNKGVSIEKGYGVMVVVLILSLLPSFGAQAAWNAVARNRVVENA
ncbi:hypothetical protein [Thiosocius teredinicola]|uniref:hypothetical protein n=1 Tax=Thiosocius teredinicola TaxID=1973002 RepID=UPI000990DB28